MIRSFWMVRAVMALMMVVGLGASLIPLTAQADGSAAVYDERADAQADVQAALLAAKPLQVPVLVVFGANWCGDCKMLDLAFKSGAAAPLIARHFRVVKVDVGRFDRNVALAERYGVPLKQGIPAVAVLSGEGKPLYVTRAGELADARRMGETGIHDFFKQVVSRTGS
jgi:thioredoxin 1